MNARLSYKPEIDGLRAIAVMSVVIFHAKITVNSENIIPGGFIGVDIFFVISGYLITSLILKDLIANSFSFKSFYERRARRILPILFTVIICSLPFAWLYLLPQQLIELANSIFYSIFFTSNFWFWSEDAYWAVDSSMKPFLHTWSLAVEEQFYLVMPILLIAIHKIKNKTLLPILILIFLCSILFAIWISPQDPELSFYLLPSRIWELLAGAIMATLEIQQGKRFDFKFSRALPKLGLILILWSFFYFTEDTIHPSFTTLAPIIGTMMIIWFANDEELTTRILRSKSFVGIGLISYGLYMWHFPIFAFSFIKGVEIGNHHKILLIITAIIISTATYISIEKPFRQKEKIPTQHLLISLSTFVLLILPISYWAQIDGFKERIPDFLNTQQKPEYLANHKWHASSDVPKGKIIVVGDSHMAAIAPTLKNISYENNYDFAVSIYKGCQLILDTNRVRKHNLRQGRCTPSLNEKRMHFLLNSPPSIVIFGGRLPLILEEDRFNNQEGGYEGQMKSFLQNPDNSLLTIAERQVYIGQKYRETLEKITEAGHKILLIYPIPEVGWHVPQKIVELIKSDYLNAGEIMTQNPITTSYSVFQRRTKNSYELLNSIRLKNLTRIYPEKLFCNPENEGRCITHDDKNLYYRDDDHLSEVGAYMLSDLIVSTINQMTD